MNMNKKNIIFFLIFFSLIIFRLEAQINVFDGLKEAFHGGKSDGYADLSSNAILPQALIGGRGDGYAMRSTVVTFDNPFYGGKGDGYAVTCLSAVIPSNIYLGGKGDGYACCADLGFSKSLHPLPVELLYFHALCSEGAVNLQWATATELNNDYFTIEKSYNAQQFFMIGTVQGSGTSSITHKYSFTDNDVAHDDGIAYYRIRQTDYNGDNSYSLISYVHCNKNLDLYSGNLFPNPVNHDVSMVFSTKQSGNLTMQITDVLGRVLYEKYIPVAEGDNLISADVSALDEAVYFFRLSGFERGTLSCQKFVKFK